jgi:hypothetical protein
VWTKILSWLGVFGPLINVDDILFGPK